MMAAKILVIDDEAIYLETVVLQLSTSGYEVAALESGIQALEYLNSNPRIDLIMLDLMMPDMYGLDVLRQLKKHPFASIIPVVLQTGIINDEEISKGLTMGAITCLRKPFSRKDLLATIGKVLQLS
jgi:putative two-component system response regulator